MKKILVLLLTVAITLSCFISCDYLGNNSNQSDENDTKKVFFVAPQDEETAVRTVSQTNEDGLKLDITLHGYKSESLGKDFYIKNNEYFLVDVTLTNESDAPVYQFLPTACRECTPAHNHEITFDIANGDYKLHSSSFGFTCAEMVEIWTVEPGQSYEWQLKLAAGKPMSYSFSTFPEGNTSKDDEKIDEKAGDEKMAVSKGTIYYNTAIGQSGNIQFYESTYIGLGGNISGSDFTLDASASTYNFVIGGTSVTITGLLPSDGSESEKLRLYEEGLFTDNLCTFEGTLSFGYMKSENGFENNLSVSAPLTIDVVYVSPIPNNDGNTK